MFIDKGNAAQAILVAPADPHAGFRTDEPMPPPTA
jgi:hypothetical protein